VILGLRFPIFDYGETDAQTNCLRVLNLESDSDYGDNFRKSAHYVDHILEGAKPGDLLVQQASKFEFIINLKAAKQIGLTIPPNVLARADKVIR
jgi:hypothetical protein